jgi:hypothetical protein
VPTVKAAPPRAGDIWTWTAIDADTQAGRQVEPQITQITQIKPGSTIFPTLASDARRPLRMRQDWDSSRRHLAYLRDLRLKTVLRHAALRPTLRRGKVVDLSPAWPWPFAAARAWFTGVTHPGKVVAVIPGRRLGRPSFPARRY